MCVIIGMKFPRDPKTNQATKGAKWYLFKVRDRNYVPEYKIQNFQRALFLTDKFTDWSEGISFSNKFKFLKNGKKLYQRPLMMVNSALANKRDLIVKKNVYGRAIRKILKLGDAKVAAKEVIKNNLDGCCLITDAENLYIVESVNGSGRVQKVSGDIIVRTNHGILTDFGYQNQNDPNTFSSKQRFKKALKITKKCRTPLELIDALARYDEIEPLGSNTPLRPFRKGKVFSTSIIALSPECSMILKKIKCKIKSKKTNIPLRILKESELASF